MDVEFLGRAGLDHAAGVKALVAVDAAGDDGALLGVEIVEDALAAQGLVALAQDGLADDAAA